MQVTDYVEYYQKLLIDPNILYQLAFFHQLNYLFSHKIQTVVLQLIYGYKNCSDFTLMSFLSMGNIKLNISLSRHLLTLDNKDTSL